MSQVPVRYAVQSSPTRCQTVFVPPYTVINTSTEDTVWIADNAGIQVGLGTPLYPGASFTWEKQGDIFAISEGPVVDIITTNDVADWEPNPIAIATAILNSGVLLVDNPVVAFSGVLEDSTPTDFIDVSRYQSAQVGLNLDVINTVPPYVLVEDWMLLPNGITMQLLKQTQVLFTDSTNDADQFQANFPLYGSHFRLSSVDGDFNATVTLSHRPQEEISCRIQNSNTIADHSYLWSQTGFTILAGATYTARFGPWFGAVTVEVRISSTAVPAAGTIRINRFSVGDTTPRISRLESFEAYPSNLYDFTGTIVMSGNSSYLQLVNNGAVDWTSCQIFVIPNNGYAGS